MDVVPLGTGVIRRDVHPTTTSYDAPSYLFDAFRKGSFLRAVVVMELVLWTALLAGSMASALAQQSASPQWSPTRIVPSPQEAPGTDCDAYAASDLDPQRKASGIPFDKINPDLAIPACESAVRKYPNSARLIYQLGRAYVKANDFGSAFTQYQKAADREYVPSEYDLGALYERGLGVAKDEARAIALYRTAAEQGDARAQTSLGSIYGLGQGVPQDYAEAAKWLRLAADQGNANAQYLLGLLYENGDGMPNNPAEAANWYRKAAAQGDDDARQRLVTLDADAKASRAAEEAGNATLRKELAAGKPAPQAWEDAALAAGHAVLDAELAAGRSQEEAKQAAQQATDQVRARIPKHDRLH